MTWQLNSIKLHGNLVILFIFQLGEYLKTLFHQKSLSSPILPFLWLHSYDKNIPGTVVPVFGANTLTANISILCLPRNTSKVCIKITMLSVHCVASTTLRT